MKVLLICVGSRGDVEPFCSLASELLKHGHHEVEFFIQPELKELAPPKANLHLFSFTQYDFYKYANNPTKELNNPNPRVKFVGIVTDLMIGLVFPCYQQVLNVAKTCDIIVTSAIARSLSFAIATKLENIPICLIHLQPLTPTTLFPHYSQVDDCVSSIMNITEGNNNNNDDSAAAKSSSSSTSNLDSYWSLEEWQHKFLQEDLDILYKEHLGLESTIDYSTTKTILSGQHPNVWLANCFYDTLIPNIVPVDDDETKNILNIGALADSYIPNEFNEPDDNGLIEFLQTKNPICVGFGSMPFGQTTDIIDVVRELNENAIFVGKALELPTTTTTDDDDDNNIDQEEEWNIQDHIRQVTTLPYGWLLPKCKIMLCHGGAGVVHSTLRAGIPVVIAPLFGDQPFWSELLQAKKIGVRVGSNLTSITKDQWKIAITKALSQDIVNNSREFGRNIESQNPKSGVERMVHALENKIVK